MHETIACKAMKIAARKVIQEGAQHSDETLIKKLTGPFGAGSQACGSTVGLTYVYVCARSCNYVWFGAARCDYHSVTPA